MVLIFSKYHQTVPHNAGGSRRGPAICKVAPPVGFNLCELQNTTGHDGNYMAKCSPPFFVMLVVCIAIITVFPVTVTWLPDVLMGK